MILLLALFPLILANSLFLFLFFKSKETKDKLFYQSIPHTLYWVAVVLASLVAKSIFTVNDAAAFGYDFILVGALMTILPAFIMGLSGCIASMKKRNTPFMLSSILSLLMVALPIGLIIFPFVSVYWLLQKEKTKKEKNKLKRALKKQKKQR